MELFHRLSVSYNTAWMLKQKLMQGILDGEALTTLTNRVEFDEPASAVSVWAARWVEGPPAKNHLTLLYIQTGKPKCMALHKVGGFTHEQVGAFTKRMIKPTADVYSNESTGLVAVISQGHSHTVMVSGGGRKSMENPIVKGVDRALGNIKSALTGTHRHVPSNHGARYGVEFQYRFNRRHDLAGMLSCLDYLGLRTPHTAHALQADETG